MEVKAGQVWKENDNRFVRRVEVVGFCEEDENKVYIKCVEHSMCFNAIGKVTTANRRRFNGQAGGYSLFKDAEGV